MLVHRSGYRLAALSRNRRGNSHGCLGGRAVQASNRPPLLPVGCARHLSWVSRAIPQLRGLWPAAGVMLLITAIGLATAGDYGMSTDEPWQIDTVRMNAALITDGTPLGGDAAYYGIVFNTLAESVFQIQRRVLSPRAEATLAAADEKQRFYQRYRDRLVSKHIVTFLVSLLAYGAVAALAGILAGWRAAWLAPLALALMPRFWGHSFFNPKDVPFAVGFTLATLAGAFLIRTLLEAPNDKRTGGAGVSLLRTLGWPAAYGVLAGLVTGVRIGGVILLLTLPVALLLVWFGERRPAPAGTAPHDAVWPPLRTWAAAYAALCAAWLGTTTLVHPVAWARPLGWLRDAVSYMSAHPWPGSLLFDGSYGPAAALPWYYLPKYLLLTTPALLLGAAAAGLAALAWRFRLRPPLERAAALLVLMQLLVIPVLAILKGSSMYDGLRQFLFILPALAVLCAVGTAAVYRLLPPRLPRWAAAGAAAAVLAVTTYDMAMLHPYEYVYFNRLSGGVAGAAGRYELDYWTLSFRNAAEWLNRTGRTDVPVLVAGNLHSANLFAAPEIQMTHIDDDAAERVTGPFFYLALNKHGYAERFPHCPVVHRVARQGADFSVIRYCGAGIRAHRE